MIPIDSLATIRQIQPDLPGISDYCREHQVKGFYPFTTETLNNTSNFYARQFNPLAGINEDAITGIAAGALGCYANRYGLSKSGESIVVEQGYDMGMGGEMYVNVTNSVTVGGYAVTYGERALTL
jgi:PhzF family phenazine biosynthesis protein